MSVPRLMNRPSISSYAVQMFYVCRPQNFNTRHLSGTKPRIKIILRGCIFKYIWGGFKVLNMVLPEGQKPQAIGFWNVDLGVFQTHPLRSCNLGSMGAVLDYLSSRHTLEVLKLAGTGEGRGRSFTHAQLAYRICLREAEERISDIFCQRIPCLRMDRRDRYE